MPLRPYPFPFVVGLGVGAFKIKDKQLKYMPGPEALWTIAVVLFLIILNFVIYPMYLEYVTGL